jgi:hypothetical protein
VRTAANGVSLREFAFGSKSPHTAVGYMQILGGGTVSPNAPQKPPFIHLG